MVITGFIISHRTLLNTFLRHVKCDRNKAVFSTLCCQHSQLYRIQCSSGISICHICQKVQCIFCQSHLITAHTTLCILYRTP